VKQRLFDRGGVREYWLVDPEHDRVTAYRRGEGGSFLRVADLGRDDVLTTPLVAALSIRLAELFA
jgi:Uma2 family endonuclease